MKKNILGSFFLFIITCIIVCSLKSSKQHELPEMLVELGFSVEVSENKKELFSPVFVKNKDNKILLDKFSFNFSDYKLASTEIQNAHNNSEDAYNYTKVIIDFINDNNFEERSFTFLLYENGYSKIYEEISNKKIIATLFHCGYYRKQSRQELSRFLKSNEKEGFKFQHKVLSLYNLVVPGYTKNISSRVGGKKGYWEKIYYGDSQYSFTSSILTATDLKNKDIISKEYIFIDNGYYYSFFAKMFFANGKSNIGKERKIIKHGFELQAMNAYVDNKNLLQLELNNNHLIAKNHNERNKFPYKFSVDSNGNVKWSYEKLNDYAYVFTFVDRGESRKFHLSSEILNNKVYIRITFSHIVNSELIIKSYLTEKLQKFLDTKRMSVNDILYFCKDSNRSLYFSKGTFSTDILRGYGNWGKIHNFTRYKEGKYYFAESHGNSAIMYQAKILDKKNKIISIKKIEELEIYEDFAGSKLFVNKQSKAILLDNRIPIIDSGLWGTTFNYGDCKMSFILNHSTKTFRMKKHD